MGIMTQNFQKLERALTDEQKKASYKKQLKEELQINLYNRFYELFYKNKEHNPDQTLSYFLNPDIKTNILNYKGFLNIIDRDSIYNKILNNVYKDFKKYYTLEIDTTKEDVKQQKEEEQKQKELERLKKEYYKQFSKNIRLKEKQQATYNKAINFSINSILAGSIIAGKTHKNKYKI